MNSFFGYDQRERKGEKDEKKMRWIPFAKTTVSYKPFRSTKTWWWWWSPFHFRCAFCWHLLIRQHIVELIMVYNQNMTSTLTSTLTNKIPFVKNEQWKKPHGDISHEIAIACMKWYIKLYSAEMVIFHINERSFENDTFLYFVITI